VLNRPEKRNALTPDMLIQISQTLNTYSADDTVRTVIIRGAGNSAFSSGYDISAIPTNVSPELKELLSNKSPFELAIESIVNYPYPVIAMINGNAFGGACDLAVSCDIRIAADDIKIGMVPARLGIVYFPEGIQRVIRTVGWSNAKEMFFTGRTYKALQLKEMGMIDYLVPREKLETFTLDFAKEISDNAPLAIKGTKRIFNLIAESQQLGGEAIQEATDWVEIAFKSEDLKEGQAAFLEKRKPLFKGK
jgi:enoyl-CoA hydratase/carnithine racemase